MYMLVEEGRINLSYKTMTNILRVQNEKYE